MPVDLISLDLSFISVLKVMTAVCEMLRPGGLLIVLIKPQFEAGRDKVRRLFCFCIWMIFARVATVPAGRQTMICVGHSAQLQPIQPCRHQDMRTAGVLCTIMPLRCYAQLKLVDNLMRIPEQSMWCAWHSSPQCISGCCCFRAQSDNTKAVSSQLQASSLPCSTCRSRVWQCCQQVCRDRHQKHASYTYCACYQLLSCQDVLQRLSSSSDDATGGFWRCGQRCQGAQGGHRGCVHRHCCLGLQFRGPH